ncbi:MAG: hypothetical protein COZ06_00315 [Armatimonadetes bacterium CG_4_10_14_3_um_filter_66_18]|nr:DUF1385 domain-containing protein [Armatimonadota bacterium]OIP11888.1 MAG: hypothetical protein AUJ96_01465 [Armatimonadetes bacterium CG2_30_66_41]PIU89433.1 MAG: hypothetical protein COS65_28445 [Armatimonadetes bacterium CG06_land_8_20_14_3_00_66_21]PIX47696.1 MAG: hypothetical protein COZ57_07845 [Armatimonadetes bacterium CG_4_8_14_3_um_filter_66_20]PIY54298.1 MAG: hypothetical protein COZ06_00315 [Armatimonadetes bacterium CG_4_10_14_3_um_filter_66_18]PIZ32709.1 MAG: hypothetical pro
MLLHPHQLRLLPVSADSDSASPAPAASEEQEFALGGQAVIEGVMMRSPNYFAVAVRRESGEILVHDERAVSFVKRNPALNRPFIRGVFALFESLILGLRALNHSANVALEDAEAKEQGGESSPPEAQPGAARKWVWLGIAAAFVALIGKVLYRRHPEVFALPRLHAVAASLWSHHSRRVLWIGGALVLFFVVERVLDAYLRRRQREEGAESAMPPGAMALTMGLSFALGIGLFVILPNAAADWFKRFTDSTILLNVYEGALRMTIFVAYVALITLLPDIRRVFQFHGAEHKVVWTQESRLELTPENARQFSTAHPRCGTSFVLFVLVLSIVIFAFFGWPSWPVRIATRIGLLPVIAGLAYEVLKLTAKKRGAACANLLITPGLWLQKLTTREPDDDQVAVAIKAMEVVLQREAEFRAEQQAA